jgi:hypothetical protein
VKILRRRVSRQSETLNTNFLCVECSRRRDESNGDGSDSLQCVLVAPWGGRGRKKITHKYIEPPTFQRLLLPVSPSPTPPTAPQIKQNKKKSSPGLSNRPCGLGPTALLSIYTSTHRGRKDTGNLQPKQQPPPRLSLRPSKKTQSNRPTCDNILRNRAP